ncbi:hypothetical protein FRC09_016539, partial [Ceratobasidium sp. 395]
MIEVPELALAVSSHIDRSDLARLACTSRSMFYLFMPLAWEHVSGIAQLFVLLPGAKTEQQNQQEIIVLPDAIDELGCLRFRTYAGFVKKLEVFSKHRTYVLKNWQGTLSHVDNHFLLPNLVSVVFDIESFESCPQYVWMRIFLSLKLQELQVVSNSKVPHRTPPLVIRALLTDLREKCHELRRLALFPSPAIQPHVDEVSQLEGQRPEDLKQPWLTNPSLQELSTNLIMLRTLSQSTSLPVLTYLRVWDDSAEDDGCSPMLTQAFPRLRHLAIHNLANHGTIEDLWQIIGPTGQELTHLELEFLSRFWNSLGWPHGGSPIMTEVISFLVTHGRQIIDLTVHNLPMLLYDIRPVPAESLIQLLLRSSPLERLCIIGARVDNIFDGILRNTFVHLKALELPHQCIGTSMLPHFAKQMPNLERLSLDLQLEPFSAPMKNYTKASALRVLRSNFLEFNTSYYQFFPKFGQNNYWAAHSLA